MLIGTVKPGVQPFTFALPAVARMNGAAVTSPAAALSVPSENAKKLVYTSVGDVPVAGLNWSCCRPLVNRASGLVVLSAALTDCRVGFCIATYVNEAAPGWSIVPYTRFDWLELELVDVDVVVVVVAVWTMPGPVHNGPRVPAPNGRLGNPSSAAAPCAVPVNRIKRLIEKRLCRVTLRSPAKTFTHHIGCRGPPF
jgi:hypothetical protein